MVDKSVQMLPEHSKQFTEQKYWSEFFTESAKRTNEQSFEWYASWKDLKPYMHKFIPEKAKVVVPGCGDSLLSEHVSLMGHNVVSFDFEPGVIEKMKQRERSLVTYEVGDMYNMHYDAKSFDVVLDKGSFDALCVDEEKETQQNVTKYCDGIKKIMKHELSEQGGFVMVSLLQDFVLSQLLSNFTKPEDKYQITIYVLHQPAMVGSSHFQRYCVHIYASEKLGMSVYQGAVGEGETKNFETVEELRKFIKLDQVQNMIGTLQVEMKEFKRGQKFAVQTDDSIQGKPRYTLNVVDTEKLDQLANKNMGCFVVPLGCERELEIESYEAQIDISNQTGLARLVIVVLGKGHKYKDLQQIQDELAPKIMDLCPKDCVNKEKIPYLTSNSKLHVREMLYEDLTVLVEDQIDSDRKGENDEPMVSRQLRFAESAQGVCQSEITLVYRNTKTSKTPITDKMQTSSELCPPRKQRALIFDRSTLTFEVHQAMLAAFSMIALEADKKLKVLVLGTGAGVLPMFLRHQINEENLASIDCVDSDPKIIELAQKQFGFTAGDGIINSHNADANDFVLKCQSKYDFIFVDIFTRQESKVQPPSQFLSDNFVKKLVSLLSDQGVCAINTLIRDEQKSIQTQQQIKTSSGCSTFVSKCSETSNEVVFVAKQTGEDRSAQLSKNVQNLNLQSGVWMSRKIMKILQHSEQMLEVKV